MTHRILRFLLLLGIAAALCGCQGGDDTVFDAQGNTRQITSNSFTYQENVRLLSPESGVEVAEIDADSVVLTGTVPTLAVGDVILRSEGPSQFTRRISSVNQTGGQTVLSTEKVGFNDIFSEADIQESITLGPEFLSSLQPALPGVTFGEPVRVLAQGTEVQTYRIPVEFKEVVVADDGRGSVIVNGEVGLLVGVRTDLNVGFGTFLVPQVNRFELTPFAVLDGHLKVTGTGSGNFRKEIPICKPFSYPLVGFAGIGLNFQGHLAVVVDGSVQAQGTFSIDEASVRLEAGVRYANGGWEAIRSAKPTFKMTPPALQGEANVSVSVAQPNVSLNLCDMGDVSVRAQVLKFEAESRLVTSPRPAYSIDVYRTYGIELGANLNIGISPIKLERSEVFPVFSGERVPVAHLGVDLPPANPQDLFTIVLPKATRPEMRVGEERLFLSFTFAQIGIVPIQFPLPVSWKSSDPSTLRLTDYGFFCIAKALKSGSARVQAVRPSGKTGEWPQTIDTAGLSQIEIVPDLLAGISPRQLDGEFLPQTLPANQVPAFGSREMIAVGTYSDGTKVDLTYAVNWTSSGSNATAFRNGQVDGRVVGQTNLRVTDPTTGRSAQADIQVVRIPIQTLVLYPVSPTNLALTGGESSQLRASARFADGSVREVTRFVRWVSSDPFIAKVNDQGLVKSETPGECIIRAIDPNGNAVAEKKVIVNRAALASLRLRPAAAGPFRAGQTQQFKATAVFADKTESSATNDVIWSTDDDSVAEISESGLVTIVGPGTFKVKALLNSVTATLGPFQVNGPAGLVFTGQPADVAPGTTFSVTIEVRDIKNQRWTEPIPVTLELSEGPQGATLGGNLTTTSSAGIATFDGLTIDQVGEGYRLRAVSNGLSVGFSEQFSGSAASNTTNRLFMNELTAPLMVGGLNVLDVASDGTFSKAFGSPYQTLESPIDITRVGKFVVVATSGFGYYTSLLQSFEYNAVDGTLTLVDFTEPNTIGNGATLLKLDSGGGNIVVSLSAFQNLLKAWRVNDDGTLTLLDTENPAGTIIDNVKYYDAPGATDYVYLSGFTSHNIIAYSLDTETGLMTEVPGSPFTHLFTGPGAMETIGANLFVVNPSSSDSGNDNMYWYDINDATGALTTHGVVHYGVGDGPIAIHAVGDLLFIANQSSTDITTYRLNSSGSGTLVSVDNGNFVSVDDANPHSFADVSLSANESALYVAASNSLAVFLLNKTTGVLTPVPGSPFSGFNSPGTIKK